MADECSLLFPHRSPPPTRWLIKSQWRMRCSASCREIHHYGIMAIMQFYISVLSLYSASLPSLI